MAYSNQRAVSDGTMALLNLSLAYFDRSELSVLFDGVVAVEGSGWAWVGTTDRQISFTPHVSNGVEVQVQRNTDISVPRHVFAEGSAFTNATLDEDIKQILHIAQEAREGLQLGDIYNDLDMHGFQIKHIGPPSDDTDAVSLGYYRADVLGAGMAKDTAVAAASTATTQAGLATTNGDAQVALAAAQVTLATTQAGNAASSAASAITSKNSADADVVLTHADVVLTHADVVMTHADVVLTHADASQTALDRAAAASSAAAAAASAGSLTTVDVQVHAASTKATPVDADELGLADSAASFGLKKFTWANLKDALLAYFSGALSALTGITSINGDGMMGRNLLINSNFYRQPDRGTAAFTPGSGLTYITDGWFCNLTQVSKLTFQQVTDAPTGFAFSEKITVASQFSPGATDRFTLVQPIEGRLIETLGFGGASAKQVVTSEYIKGSVAGNYTVSIRNGNSTRSYVGIVAVTTSWVPLAITLVGDTTGAWATDNTIGLTVAFDLGSGSNYNTTAGSWQAGNFTRTAGSVTFVNQVAGSTLNITGCQLEPGSVATQWKPHVGPFGGDDLTCLRYFETGTVQLYLSSGGTGYVGSSVRYVATKRTTPTVTPTDAAATPGKITYLSTSSGVQTSNNAYTLNQNTVSEFNLVLTSGVTSYGIVYTWTSNTRL